MRLSRPISLLKRKAKLLAREKGIFLHEALDHVAAEEGFPRWSLLSAKASTQTPAGKLYAKLNSGDLLLVGARPRQGKTLFALRLLVEAMTSGRRSFFFSLEYNRNEMLDRFNAIGVKLKDFESFFKFDNSDDICADHIMRVLAAEPHGAFAVIDYLQLLDQKRGHPDLSAQVSALRSFAREREHVFVFISQIDRAYDTSARSFPDIDDIRLPNPLDLSLFSKTCFLHNGEVRFGTAS